MDGGARVRTIWLRPGRFCWFLLQPTFHTRRKDKQKVGKRIRKIQTALRIFCGGASMREIRVTFIVGIEPDVVRPRGHILGQHAVFFGFDDSAIKASRFEASGPTLRPPQRPMS
jgi:hypothetical protein